MEGGGKKCYVRLNIIDVITLVIAFTDLHGSLVAVVEYQAWGMVGTQWCWLEWYPSTGSHPRWRYSVHLQRQGGE